MLVENAQEGKVHLRAKTFVRKTLISLSTINISEVRLKVD